MSEILNIAHDLVRRLAKVGDIQEIVMENPEDFEDWEDLEDIVLAEQVLDCMRRGEESVCGLEEVEKRLGLED